MDRASEVAKYEAAYQSPEYRLGSRRKAHIVKHLTALPKGSLLDVSTGRGEVLDIADDLGFAPVCGTEAVDYLCGGRVTQALAHELPFDDNAFDVVTMFDVMEHLLPCDTSAVCNELKRVARKRILLTVHNGPHVFKGQDLHINRRSGYDEWHEELKAIFGCPVIRHGKDDSISEMFEVVK